MIQYFLIFIKIFLTEAIIFHLAFYIKHGVKCIREMDKSIK